jgi:hypothetical protein
MSSLESEGVQHGVQHPYYGDVTGWFRSLPPMCSLATGSQGDEGRGNIQGAIPSDAFRKLDVVPTSGHPVSSSWAYRK